MISCLQRLHPPVLTPGLGPVHLPDLPEHDDACVYHTEGGEKLCSCRLCVLLAVRLSVQLRCVPNAESHPAEQQSLLG